MSEFLIIPPGLLLICGGLLAPLIPATLRFGWLLAVTALTLVASWLIPDGPVLSTHFLGYTLEIVEADALSRVFATVFLVVAFAGIIFAKSQRSTTETAAALCYAGGAVGAVFAGDLITLFVFLEIMTFASTVIVWIGGSPASRGAGMRYAIIHLLAGVLLMTGIVGHAAQSGSVDLVAMHADGLPTWLILIGVLINAGAPPLSSWLPDAYPEASWSGTVFLSAFTTKTAVYTLVRCFPGEQILIFVGLYMAIYGIVYALLENDMRRILAYSIVNQVGFMVTGVGIGSTLALNGVVAHAFAHILYKALLLMAAGAVLFRTDQRKCSDLGGLFKTMPITCLMAVIGALAISAFPLTSGYTTKSMIVSAAHEASLAWVWFILEAASAGVFLHAGIKFPWFVFFQKDSCLRPKEAPLSMRAAMTIMAAFCIGLGVVPGPLYHILPWPVTYAPYTIDHTVHQLQLLLFAGLAFFVLLPLLRRTRTISLDTDWLYRRLLPAMIGRASRVRASLGNDWATVASGVVAVFMISVETCCGRRGLLARRWEMTTTIALMLALLATYLVVIGCLL